MAKLLLLQGMGAQLGQTVVVDPVHDARVLANQYEWPDVETRANFESCMAYAVDSCVMDGHMPLQRARLSPRMRYALYGAGAAFLLMKGTKALMWGAAGLFGLSLLRQRNG